MLERIRRVSLTAFFCFFPNLIRCNFASRVKLLLCHKADASITNAKGELPLHRACYNDSNMRVSFSGAPLAGVKIIAISFPSLPCSQSVMALAEVTPNINAQDKDGWTALMCASKSQSCLIVHYLLQRSACPALQQVCLCHLVYICACIY